MQRENEDKSARGYAIRKKRYKRTRILLVLILLLVVAAIGVMALYSIYNRSYHGYKVIKSTDIKGETTVGYLSFGSSIIKYGKDGAIAYKQDGKVQWNCSYNMSDPVVDVCDNYVVIADRGNKQIRVISSKGKVDEYSSEFNIVKVEVAGQGVVAALMEEGNSNYIKLYDLEGNVLAEKKTGVKEKDSGYPMDISLSNDGTKLAVSYMSITDNEIISRFGFYNFSDVGKNHSDQYVGGFNCEKGSIATRIEFVNNDTVCVYKNSGFELYKVKEIPKLIKKIPIKEKIKSIIYNSLYTGVVTEANSESDKNLLLYNLSGKCILDKQIKLNYKKIFLINKELILYDDLTCNIIRVSGKLKFNYTFDGDITDIYPINNLDRYYLVSESKISSVQLKD